MLFTKTKIIPGFQGILVVSRDVRNMVETTKRNPGRRKGCIEVAIKLCTKATVNRMTSKINPDTTSPHFVDPWDAYHITKHFPRLSSYDTTSTDAIDL